MKALLLTFGSRGDYQPFISLAVNLKQNGHEVELFAPESAKSLATEYGVSMTTWKSPPAHDERTRGRTNRYPRIRLGSRSALLVSALRQPRPKIAEILPQMTLATEQEADMVAYHPLLPGEQLAERMGIPSVLVEVQPTIVPTSAFTHPIIGKQLPRVLNSVSYQIGSLTRFASQGRIFRWRRDSLFLPRRRGYRDIFRQPDGTNTTVLQAYSRHIIPAESNYSNSIHCTGYWFLSVPPNWAPSKELSEFLNRDALPIAVGFGSVIGRDPARISRIVAEAIRLAGVRAVVGSGWGGLQRELFDDENVLFVDDIPYSWLFSRTAAIVHHGGSGTTGSALAAGRPQVACPFSGPQALLARRMQALGVATRAQPAESLDPENLAHAIRQAITSTTLADRAETLGTQVRSESGADAAVEILESLISG